MVDRTYMPDLASLDTGFPPGLPAPRLLREFAHWLADKPRSSVGWFHFASEPLAASYVHDDHAAELLREQLGCFMRLANGAHIALWMRPEQTPPVVCLGANAQVSEVAPSLEAFLLALARARTGVSDLDREPSSTRAALADWLAARGVVDRPSEPRSRPHFADWFATTVAAARPAAHTPVPAWPPLPRDLFERTDPWLGLLADDARMIAGFAALGIDLAALRDPAALRCIARSPDGLAFELAWPWDYPSHWLEEKFPKPVRREIEQRRARMLWGVTFYLVHERKRVSSADVLEFSAYPGPLPLGISGDGDLAQLEARLGPPTRGRMGSRVWDDIRPHRTLTVLLNEGPFQRPDLATGTLRELTWRISQSS